MEEKLFEEIEELIELMRNRVVNTKDNRYFSGQYIDELNPSRRKDMENEYFNYLLNV